jgi:CelD/BcsL family acetyltransferase involved in cellulose biosynthesis
MRAKLIDDVDALAAYAEAWDELAVESARPYSSPVWLLPWWRQASPAGARLRTVVVLDAEELVAVAPFYATGEPGLALHRLLGDAASLGVEPLAREGAAEESARLVASMLAGKSVVLDLQGIRAASPWPRFLAEAWPGGARLKRERSMGAPALSLADGSFEDWLAAKSKHFRSQVRRDRRRLDAAGALIRLAEKKEELAAGLEAFAALHRARWDERGGSGVLTKDVERMLSEVSVELGPSGRLRLWTVEVDGKVIAADIWLAAGGEVSWWLTGFDDEWHAMTPTLQLLVAALEHAWASGDNHVDFGAGDQLLKSRLADDEVRLDWLLLVPRGRPLTSIRLLPRELKRRIPVGARQRLKRLLPRSAVRAD